LGITNVITNRKKQSIFLIISGGWRKNEPTNWSKVAFCFAFHPIFSYLCTLNWARPQFCQNWGWIQKSGWK
jgi:hypothetical protein